MAKKIKNKYKIFYLRPWMFVLTGVMLTTLSALITHYKINNDNNMIKNSIMAIKENEITIEKLWENYQILENKKDYAFVMMNMNIQKNEESIKNYIIKIMQLADIEYDDILNLPLSDFFTEFQLRLEEHKKIVIENIDNRYINKLNLENNISNINRENSLYTNIALFFQIIGLILVLSKDLSYRKTELE